MKFQSTASTSALLFARALARAQNEVMGQNDPIQSTPSAPLTSIHYADSSCDAYKETIQKEMDKAFMIADDTARDPTYGDYYEHFFHNDLRSQPGYDQTIKTRFEHMKEMLGGAGANTFSLTCDPTSDGCTKKGWWAHASPSKSAINLCPLWLNPHDRAPWAADADANCKTKNLRYFQHAKAAILVHEVSHLPYSMNRAEGSLDVVYGFNGCEQLGAGTYDRSCRNNGDPKVLCPSAADPTKDGICSPQRSEDNADTYAFVAAGVHFSIKCGISIPYPTGPGDDVSPPPADQVGVDEGDQIQPDESVEPVARALPPDGRMLRGTRRVGIVPDVSNVRRDAVFPRANCPEDDGIVWDGPEDAM